MRDNLWNRMLDILENHDTEEDLIADQMDYQKKRLEAELERIYDSLGVKGIGYDGIKVQSSKNPDENLANAIAACERARDLYADVTYNLQMELNQIKSVYQEILWLDHRDKNVIMALYYPRRSGYAAAKILHCSKTTMYSWRNDALKRLYERCVEKNIL